MGSTYNGRLFSLIEEQDQPVAMLWDAQVFDLDGWIIPKVFRKTA
jgi:putative spermidine/putrescine transport system substrate-binding protein